MTSPSLAGGLSRAFEALNGRLVENGPEQTELLNRVDQLLEVNRLDDVGIDPKLIALHEVLLFAGGGEDDDRNRFHLFVALDLAKHLHAIDLGHFQVEQDDGG